MKHRKGKNSDSTQGIVVFSGLASSSFFKAGVLRKAYSKLATHDAGRIMALWHKSTEFAFLKSKNKLVKL